MKRGEFLEIMRELNMVYGERKFPLNQEILTVWHKYLGDLDERVLHKAVESLVKRSAYSPAISEILKEYRRIEGQATTELAEFDRVFREIVAKYPGARSQAEDKALFEEITGRSIAKADGVLRAVENAILTHELAQQDMPPLGEFLERFVE